MGSEENRGALVEVLTYHVVSGNVMSSDLTAGNVPTVEGQAVTVSLDPVMINSANVVTADVGASNGVIHVIDSVLIPDGVLPETDTNQSETDTKLQEINWISGFRDPSARVTAVDAGTTLNFSWPGYHDVVIVPSKEAFDSCDFSEGKSLGDESPISSTVTETTYFVCTVPGHCAAGQKLEATVSSTAVADEPTTSVVDIAVSDDAFSTLVSLLQQAELVETLSGPGPFTVFAPTNEAFAALPESTVAWLTSEENRGSLVEVLTYHVVSGNVMSSDLTAGNVPTVEGQAVTVSLDPVMINSANVVTADVGASNGVIHVIDSVLIPDGLFANDEDMEEVEVMESDSTDDIDSSGYFICAAGISKMIGSVFVLSVTIAFL